MPGLDNITKFAGVPFDPEVFMELQEEFDPNPTAFVQSGILRKDPLMSIGEGNFGTVPFFKPLGGESQNYTGVDIEVNPITAATQSFVVVGRANAWGSQDLAAELATKDPMRSIALKTAKYWQVDRQKTLISTLNGCFASPSLSGHVYDISVDDGNAAAGANLMGSDAIIEAIQSSLGDVGDKIKAMSIHSKVYARLQSLNLIEFIPLGSQNILVPHFLGKSVIVDDTMPRVAGSTSGFKYTTYLYAENSIAQGDGKVKVPAEANRDPLRHGGTDFIVNRHRYVYVPYGASFVKKTMAAVSPTNAELELGENWELVYEKKNFPIVKLVTNG